MVAEELGPVTGASLNAEDDENRMGEWKETRSPFVDVHHSQRRRQGRRFQSGSYRHVQTQPTPKPQ
jgi:hypothetical protein